MFISPSSFFFFPPFSQTEHTPFSMVLTRSLSFQISMSFKSERNSWGLKDPTGPRDLWKILSLSATILAHLCGMHCSWFGKMMDLMLYHCVWAAELQRDQFYETKEKGKERIRWLSNKANVLPTLNFCKIFWKLTCLPAAGIKVSIPDSLGPFFCQIWGYFTRNCGDEILNKMKQSNVSSHYLSVTISST